MQSIVRLRNVIFISLAITVTLVTSKVAKEEVDKVIEDEITLKLSEDLLQSIERKFQVDLETSVDQVLTKIKLLLQNGTTHIQDRLSEMQSLMEEMIKDSGDQVDECLMKKQNETVALAEKALHQMVVCGYALIGHDPSQAVKSVLALKSVIKQGIEPIHEKRSEVYNLLKVCGHDHDTLKKVIKCVISKSPLLKSAMMEISGKLVDGVVKLSKLMAHGAMHEACLVEVISSVEDEAFALIRKVKKCTYNETEEEDFNADLDKYLKEDNATVLDINRDETPHEDKEDTMKEVIRRMLGENKKQEIEERFQEKMKTLQNDLKSDLLKTED